MQTVYKFDKHGHYINAENAMQDPITGDLLLPSDCVTFAPDEKKLASSWAKLNEEKTAWTYTSKPTTAKECLGISVKHEDQCPWAYEMRELMENLCKADAEHYRTTRDDNLVLTVEVIPEKTLDELITEKHSSLKGTMASKRQALKVTYDNDTFDANEDAQANMIVLLKSFDLGATSVSIRSTTEQTHVFNQAHTNELSLLMLNAVDTLYKKYWELKDALYKCATVDEVNAIVWE